MGEMRIVLECITTLWVMRKQMWELNSKIKGMKSREITTTQAPKIRSKLKNAIDTLMMQGTHGRLQRTLGCGQERK